MPTPQADESREDWMERCVPMVMDEGTADSRQQAIAMCSSMWDSEHDPMKDLDKAIQRVNAVLDKRRG